MEPWFKTYERNVATILITANHENVDFGKLIKHYDQSASDRDKAWPRYYTYDLVSLENLFKHLHQFNTRKFTGKDNSTALYPWYIYPLNDLTFDSK